MVSVESRTPNQQSDLDVAGGKQEVAAQDATSGVTELNENRKIQTPINMSGGGENNADAMQTVGGGLPPRSSAVTTLVSSGSQSQNPTSNNNNNNNNTANTNNSTNTNVAAGNTKKPNTPNNNSNNPNTASNSNVNNNNNSGGAVGSGGGSGSVTTINNLKSTLIIDDDELTEGPSPAGVTPRGYWGVHDNSGSRGTSPTMDNMSEISSQAPNGPGGAGLSRSKSRTDVVGVTPLGSGGIGNPGPSGILTGSNSNIAASSGRISNQLSFWKARCLTFYRNGDPFFNGLEFRFKPGRDISNLERLLDKISTRMDLPRGARYIFGMDGDRKFDLDELEDGSSYVVSSYKQFKIDIDFDIEYPTNFNKLLEKFDDFCDICQSQIFQKEIKDKNNLLLFQQLNETEYLDLNIKIQQIAWRQYYGG